MSKKRVLFAGGPPSGIGLIIGGRYRLVPGTEAARTRRWRTRSRSWEPAIPRVRQAPAARAPAPPAAPDKDAPVVAVTGGKTAGGVYGDVAIYRGIPFAAPPVGDLRWRAPQPVKAWTDTRKGIDFGGTCTAAEDCLYLNVYKPADAKPGAKLPVMVWIYGGAFTGGASQHNYEGQSFRRRRASSMWR